MIGQAAAQGHACQCCGAAALEEVEAFRTLPRVSSDSRPVAPGGRLFACAVCGLVQKIADQVWLQEISEIYAAYDMHHQSGMPDQVVFDPVSGAPAGRCQVLARRLAQSGQLASEGKLLDVGTGSGAMVSGFASQFAGWQLYGLDLDDRKAGALSAIAGFERLYTCPPEAIGMRFDLVSLVHTLEHFASPRAMLGSLQGRLNANGKLFVEVNNVAATPFDLVVADHLCHFTQATLHALVAAAGFSVQALHTSWIAKELSLIAAPSDEAAGPTKAASSSAQALPAVRAQVQWLGDVLAQAAHLAREGLVGVFGTSVAATWLAGALGESVAFFVDEDPFRAGRLHMDRPVFSPANAPAATPIYLAFPEPIAQAISQRLAPLGLSVCFPGQAT